MSIFFKLGITFIVISTFPMWLAAPFISDGNKVTNRADRVMAYSMLVFVFGWLLLLLSALVELWVIL